MKLLELVFFLGFIKLYKAYQSSLFSKHDWSYSIIWKKTKKKIITVQLDTQYLMKGSEKKNKFYANSNIISIMVIKLNTDKEE